MRDPARIDRITEKLNKVWHIVPDQRLGQIVSNLLGPGPQDIFQVEDDRWEERLDELLEDGARIRE